MPSSSRVGDFVTLVRGKTYKGTLVGADGPALLGLGSIIPGGGFRNDYKTYGGDCPPELMLGPGDLFVSLKGATKDGEMIGSVARVPELVPSGRLTQDTVKLVFRERDAAFERYLYWLLRTPDYRRYCAGRATGSAVVALSRDDFLSYPVPMLTRTRVQIVNVLERLDDKIESNRRVQATGQELLRVIVSDAADTSSGDEGVLADYCQLVKLPAPASSIEPNANYIGLEHMPKGSIFLDGWAPAVGLGSGKWRFEEGDILFGRLRPYFKKVGIAPVAGVCSTDILVLRPNDRTLTALVVGIASSDALIDSLSAAATGTRMPRASWADLANWPVPRLTEDERSALAAETVALLARLTDLTYETKRLESLRDALLPELLSRPASMAKAQEAVA